MMNKLAPITDNNLKLKFLAFLARYSLSAQKVVNSNLKEFVFFLQDRNIRLQQINQDIINLFLASLREQGYQNSTYNLKTSNVKKFLDYLGIIGLEYKRLQSKAYDKLSIIDKDSFARIIRYLKEKKEIPSKKQIKYLSQYILFSILYYCALRKHEAISLKYSDIVNEGGKYFYIANTKFSKIVKKEFPPSLVTDLFRLKQIETKSNSDYIFSSKYSKQGKPISDRAINYILNYYYRKVTGKTNTVTVHGIKNLSGIETYKATNNDILATMNHLNHNRLDTTHRYLSKVKARQVSYYAQLENSLNISGENNEKINSD